MSRIAVTADLDWACEAAIEGLLDFLVERRIPVTVFATHRSSRVEAAMATIEVGLHPFFGDGSDHGATIDEVVRHVCDLPHNLPAFRCHRFAVSNESRQAMAAAGMRISSNVCADLEIVPPFIDRCGLLEMPVFFEDGGFLWRQHPLAVGGQLAEGLAVSGTAVLLVHPMHFALNTPHFNYMADIKRSTGRSAWRGMTSGDLAGLRWGGRGIRDVVVDLLDRADEQTSLGQLAHARLNVA